MIVRSCLLAVAVTAQYNIDNAIDNVNTFDVFIQLFDDEYCHFQSENLLLTTQNCYANRYEKPTTGAISMGFAFMVSIVSFHNKTSAQGTSQPRLININYYSDACHTPYGPPMQMVEGQCSGLQSRPVFHTLHGWFSLRRRTTGGLTKECAGGPHFCSTIQLVHNQFYASTQCDGMSYKSYSYPVGRECLRYNNGTQFFFVDDIDGQTVYEYDYPLSPDCTEDGMGCTNCVQKKIYQLQLGYCYALLDRDGFQWRLDPTKDISASDAAAQVSDCAYVTQSAGLASILVIAWTA
eukprot:GEMP01035926.1.p1 GENE.GEMP01035926.1~~GEMP01035926.1.p1  ORF type:complete len:293 (+),score=34.84 GEMP01035926.1:38-916(+)